MGAPVNAAKLDVDAGLERDPWVASRRMARRALTAEREPEPAAKPAELIEVIEVCLPGIDSYRLLEPAAAEVVFPTATTRQKYAVSARRSRALTWLSG